MQARFNCVVAGSEGEGEQIIYADGEKEDDVDEEEEVPFGPTGLKETEHSDDDEVCSPHAHSYTH